jgi:hypothetical protein
MSHHESPVSPELNAIRSLDNLMAAARKLHKKLEDGASHEELTPFELSLLEKIKPASTIVNEENDRLVQDNLAQIRKRMPDMSGDVQIGA